MSAHHPSTAHAFEAIIQSRAQDLRPIVDEALRSWISRGEIAEEKWLAFDCEDSLEAEAAYREALAAHKLRCVAVDEGLWCCLEQDHENYGHLVEHISRRLAESLLTFRGWMCSACAVWNGDEKERLSACRACGLARR
jgi:hypothetical protein